MSLTHSQRHVYLLRPYISIACGSNWTFFTVCHVEFDKEAISYGFKANSLVLREVGFEFQVILESWASVVLLKLVLFSCLKHSILVLGNRNKLRLINSFAILLNYMLFLSQVDIMNNKFQTFIHIHFRNIIYNIW